MVPPPQFQKEKFDLGVVRGVDNFSATRSLLDGEGERLSWGRKEAGMRRRKDINQANNHATYLLSLLSLSYIIATGNSQ